MVWTGGGLLKARLFCTVLVPLCRGTHENEKQSTFWDYVISVSVDEVISALTNGEREVLSNSGRSRRILYPPNDDIGIVAKGWLFMILQASSVEPL